MSPREMTATSLVPPPMSTTMQPVGSPTGRPAPMAAAMGSSIKSTLLEPAWRAASSTARRSTSVTPEGMHTTMRGRLRVLDFSAFLMKYFSMAAVTSKSAMTPSFKGRTADNGAGGAAQHLLGLLAHSQHLVGAHVHSHHRGLPHHNALAPHKHQCIRSPQVDADVLGEHSKHRE